MEEGLPQDVDVLASELQVYWDVLLGRMAPPVDLGVATLMEVAQMYLARAQEIDAKIKRLERRGESVGRANPYYKFRTGELRTFIEMTTKAFELGSRRVTVARMEQEAAGWTTSSE